MFSTIVPSRRGSGTTLEGINNSGPIVGDYAIPSSVSGGNDYAGEGGFLGVGGSFSLIDVPEVATIGTSAYSITDIGRITGDHADASLSSHGFMWKIRASF